MNFKKTSIAVLIMIAILTIGAVNASEDLSDGDIGFGESQDPIALDESQSMTSNTNIYDASDTASQNIEDNRGSVDEINSLNATINEVDDSIETNTELSKSSTNKILSTDEKLTFNDLASLISEGSGGGMPIF